MRGSRQLKERKLVSGSGHSRGGFCGDKMTVESVEPVTPFSNQVVCLSHFLFLALEIRIHSIVMFLNPHLIAASTQPEQQFRARIYSYLRQTQQYRDPVLIAKAVSVLPIEKLHENARERLSALPPESTSSLKDELAKALLHWFKHTFFRWFQPKCAQCGGACNQLGACAPNAFEKSGLASRVELYQCKSATCQAILRYPRYNHAGRLLDTRVGRCGEFAQAFTLLSSALGFDTRFVVDWTDHVWAELWSEHLQRWVHCDCCENTFNSPLMYESGWGKKLTFVIGFSTEEAVDVTKKYTQKWADPDGVLVRRQQLGLSEVFVQTALKGYMDQLGIFITPARHQVLGHRRQLDLVHMSGQKAREADRTEQRDRISGDAEWKKQRGEFSSHFKPENHDFVVLQKANWRGIKKKFAQFQVQVRGTEEPEEGESESELNVMERLDTFRQSDGQGYLDLHADVLEVLETWPPSKMFPILDALRVAVLKESFASFCSSEERMSLFEPLAALAKSSRTSYANMMMVLRFFSNFVTTQTSAFHRELKDFEWIRDNFFRDPILFPAKKEFCNAHASLCFNLSLLSLQIGLERSAVLLRHILRVAPQLDEPRARKKFSISIGVLAFVHESLKPTLRETRGSWEEWSSGDDECLEALKKLVGPS